LHAEDAIAVATKAKVEVEPTDAVAEVAPETTEEK
jgi:hypothetical protein